MTDNDIALNDYQHLVSSNNDLAHIEQLDGATDEDAIGDDDPLMARVFEIAKLLLGSQDHVTIKDVMERIPAGDSAIRNRLNKLVELQQLDCLSGSGRRPSFYYFPEESQSSSLPKESQSSSLPEGAEGMSVKYPFVFDEDYRILNLLQAQQKEKQKQMDDLQKELTDISEDIKAIHRTIKLKSQFASSQ